MWKYLFIFLLINGLIQIIDGSIQVCNKGAYLANCYLESRPFSYGFQIRRFETGLFPVGQCASLSVPADAVWNRLECKTLAFIAVYKSIFVQEFASAMYNYCYKITGTTLSPQWSQTQCSNAY